MKKQIPILFSTAMVQAVYPREAKSQTRRTRGLERINERPDDWLFDRFETNIKGGLNAVFKPKEEFSLDPDWNESFPCPYGKPGDILWVRETWRKYYRVDEHGYTQFDEELIEYAADGPAPLPMVDGDGFTMYDKKGHEKYIPWRPSIHMPKIRSRIWLEVTDIRVERLQDISEADAIAEGVEFTDIEVNGKRQGRQYRDYLQYTEDVYEWFVMAKSSFRTLWRKINGFDSWEANPWVWVVSFKVLSTTGKPEMEKEGVV